jgi:transposase-like protein
MKNERHHLTKSPVVESIPLVCSNELAAVEFFENQRWGNTPACVKCGSVNVYKMKDVKTGERSRRYLWRCHDCKEQYTVRIGTVYEESRIGLRHWAYAYWRAATSKKGVAALEIMRDCQISYKSALFLMNRIRFAMAPEQNETPKLNGIVEADETYIGGKPRRDWRFRPSERKCGRGTEKTPVFAVVERGGEIRSRVIADVTAHTLKSALREVADKNSRVMTDDYVAYKGLASNFRGGHDTIRHSRKQYVRGDVHTNTVESSFALMKRGLHGIYHAVSKKHLHRYLWQFDFVWNHRFENDGERIIAAVKSAEGKRMMYKQAVA